VGQNGIALSLHNTATAADGRILDEELATVLTIDHGQIIKIDTYLSNVPMMEKYFSK
jgi:ketosteroid isomerase-like protein